MKISILTEKEREVLNLINSTRKTPIKWDKMPKQEVYTHLYGWNNPHIDINILLTPKEKNILIKNGYQITNELKKNVELLSKVRKIRKNPSKIVKI
jgi:hypothetical protein